MARTKWIEHATQRELRARVEHLESEIAELRRHHMRVAELTDLVQELLVPMAQRDEARVERALEAIQKGI